jgi:hypothetical protein
VTTNPGSNHPRGGRPGGESGECAGPTSQFGCSEHHIAPSGLVTPSPVDLRFLTFPQVVCDAPSSLVTLRSFASCLQGGGALRVSQLCSELSMPFTTPARRLTEVEDATFELAGGSMGADPKEPLLTDLRNQTRLSELEAVLHG